MWNVGQLCRNKKKQLHPETDWSMCLLELRVTVFCHKTKTSQETASTISCSYIKKKSKLLCYYVAVCDIFLSADVCKGCQVKVFISIFENVPESLSAKRPHRSPDNREARGRVMRVYIGRSTSLHPQSLWDSPLMAPIFCLVPVIWEVVAFWADNTISHVRGGCGRVYNNNNWTQLVGDAPFMLCFMFQRCYVDKVYY